MSKLVVVKIRGSIDSSQKTSKTLQTLGLEKKHQARVMENTDSHLGNMHHAKDYIAYGEVSDEVAEEVGEVGETVNLSPPSGGFKSTKRQFHQGGSLGKRDDMKSLLNKMN